MFEAAGATSLLEPEGNDAHTGTKLDSDIGATLVEETGDGGSTVGAHSRASSASSARPPLPPPVASSGDAQPDTAKARRRSLLSAGSDGGDSDGSESLPDVTDDAVVPSKVARQRLTQALTQHRHTLDLSSLGLRGLPTFHLPWLKEVCLSGNRLAMFPEALCQVCWQRAVVH